MMGLVWKRSGRGKILEVRMLTKGGLGDVPRGKCLKINTLETAENFSKFY